MGGDPDLEAVPEPEELVGKDELDEDDEMELTVPEVIEPATTDDDDGSAQPAL